jgi:putative oxidoreductase
MGIINFINSIFNKLRVLDFLGPLALRLYLVPVFWMAGTSKIDFSTFMPFESTVSWFGNSEWGLGLPLPTLMAFLAGWTEVLGAIFLLVGFGVRWISIPLMATMLVAIFSVHISNGWLAISSGSGLFATERTMEAVERLGVAKDILKEHGNYSWLTENGGFVSLNNGIEFATTYFIMLLVLFFIGAGKFFSLDYYLNFINKR